MAKSTATVETDAPTITPSGRKIEVREDKPRHLSAHSGPGRTRQPTEFDDLIPEWYEADKWFKIPAEGETTEEQLEDLALVHKAVYRAAQLHDLGVTRLKEDDPTRDDFAGYGVWIFVRPKQVRKAKTDTTDDETNESYDGEDTYDFDSYDTDNA